MRYLHESDYIVSKELKKLLLKFFSRKRAVPPFFYWTYKVNKGNSYLEGYNPLLVENYEMITIGPGVEIKEDWPDQLNKATKEISIEVKEIIDFYLAKDLSEIQLRKELSSKFSMNCENAFRIKRDHNPLENPIVIPYKYPKELKGKGYIKQKDSKHINITLDLAETFNWSLSHKACKALAPRRILFNKDNGNLIFKWNSNDEGHIGWNGTNTLIIGSGDIYIKEPNRAFEVENLETALEIKGMLENIKERYLSDVKQSLRQKVLLNI